MDCKIISGRSISKLVKADCRTLAGEYAEKGIHFCLAVIIVGDDPASQIYVRNKKRACESIGIKSITHVLHADTPQDKLLKLIQALNDDTDVTGILVQLPLPRHIDESAVINAISPEKDVDCFTPVNTGLLYTGNPRFMPCTPAGIIELLDRSGIEIEGSDCVVIGRSNIVGKPVAALLTAGNATVTLCHSRTRGLAEITKRADILVAAIGKPRFVTADMIKPGAVLIDVGVNRLDNGKVCGDIDFDGCVGTAGAITPVPGGVGPMTIAMLMKNCLLFK